MAKICIICCDKSKKYLICNYCNYESCVDCNQRYLLGSFKDPSCMSCKKTWSHEFMTTQFTKKFITTEYKKHREDILIDREMSMMPITQPYIERENRIKQIDEEIYSLKVKMHTLKDEQYNLIDINRAIGSDTHKSPNLTYINRCCVEDCKGFISKEFKCGICNTQMCSKCHCILEEDHECNQETVETVKLLLQDTKSCPKCFKPITKNGGCAQICCTGCHCVFDWKTGEITTNPNNIHNPYYYEWLNELGRQGLVTPYGEIINNNECALYLPNYTTIVNLLRQQKVSEKDNTYIMNAHRLLQHVRNVEIRVQNDDEFSKNFDLRKKYLNNILDKEKFKFLLQKREKAYKKKIEIIAIYNLFEETGREMMHKYMNNKDIKIFKEDFNKIITYCNTGFSKTRVHYGGIVPMIGVDTLMISTV